MPAEGGHGNLRKGDYDQPLPSTFSRCSIQPESCVSSMSDLWREETHRAAPPRVSTARAHRGTSLLLPPIEAYQKRIKLINRVDMVSSAARGARAASPRVRAVLRQRPAPFPTVQQRRSSRAARGASGPNQLDPP